MKRILLVGCGAEIGSLLVGMIDPEKDGLEIAAILTHSIGTDPKHPTLTGVDSLIARVVLAQPHMLDHIRAAGSPEGLVVRGRTIPVYWGDATTYDFSQLPGPYDVCVVATSEKQVKDTAFMNRFMAAARFVVGVAESDGLPAIYYPLLDVPDRLLPVPPVPIGDSRVFCFGSCQSNGWQALLRGLVGIVETSGMTSFDLTAAELDIVHPDTPTGRLSTKSVAARDQDARNNFRPGFSQVETVMKRLFPGRHTVNTISLRTLIMPPSYQICRFFFRYELPGGRRLDHDAIVTGLRSAAQARPYAVRVADLPLGSRGFEQCESAAVILPQQSLLHFSDDPFRLGAQNGAPLSELIVQAYVHNTRGYCRTIVESMKYLTSGAKVRVFPATRT